MGSQGETYGLCLSPADGHCSDRRCGSGLEMSIEFHRKEASDPGRGSGEGVEKQMTEIQGATGKIARGDTAFSPSDSGLLGVCPRSIYYFSNLPPPHTHIFKMSK